MAACSVRSSTARLIAAAERAGCELHPHKVPTLGSTLGASHAGQMLQVRASSAAAAHDQRWCGGTEPAISHPGLRGCVRRALGHGARLYVDTSLGQRPQDYSSHASVILWLVSLASVSFSATSPEVALVLARTLTSSVSSRRFPVELLSLYRSSDSSCLIFFL